jgi:putative hydrolase of the HAD superfamily
MGDGTVKRGELRAAVRRPTARDQREFRQDRGMPVRAVVFDLWDTIVDFDQAWSERLNSGVAERLGVSYDRFVDVWYSDELTASRNVGPIAPCLSAACETLGVGADVDGVLAWRLELVRRALVPRPGLLDTLGELRARGLRLGLVSNCTEEVALVWADTAFGHLFDHAVFSATAGLAKPDPAIYRLAADGLGVELEECLFVGDGANDELRGARDVGMTPVLMHPDGREPYWEEVRRWDGLRVRTVPDILELVQ